MKIIDPCNKVLGPIMNNDVGLVREKSGAFAEETNTDSESRFVSEENEGTTENPSLEEQKRRRKKASEERSWYNLW